MLRAGRRCFRRWRVTDSRLFCGLATTSVGLSAWKLGDLTPFGETPSVCSGARETAEDLGVRVMVSQAMRCRRRRAGRVDKECRLRKVREGDGEVDVVGIYGFWVNGPWGGGPFPSPALRRARMTDGTALCQARREPLRAGLLLIGCRLRWIRLRTRLRFKVQRQRCRLGSCPAADARWQPCETGAARVAGNHQQQSSE